MRGATSLILRQERERRGFFEYVPTLVFASSTTHLFVCERIPHRSILLLTDCKSHRSLINYISRTYDISSLERREMRCVNSNIANLRDSIVWGLIECKVSTLLQWRGVNFEKLSRRNVSNFCFTRHVSIIGYNSIKTQDFR